MCVGTDLRGGLLVDITPVSDNANTAHRHAGAKGAAVLQATLVVEPGRVAHFGRTIQGQLHQRLADRLQLLIRRQRLRLQCGTGHQGQNR